MYKQLFFASSLDDNFTFTFRIHTLWFKTRNVTDLCVCTQVVFHCWHVYCYHLNCELYINCLKLGNLNIGVTPNPHTLGRYLLFSDIEQKVLIVLNVNRKPQNKQRLFWMHLNWLFTGGSMPAQGRPVHLSSRFQSLFFSEISFLLWWVYEYYIEARMILIEPKHNKIFYSLFLIKETTISPISKRTHTHNFLNWANLNEARNSSEAPKEFGFNGL